MMKPMRNWVGVCVLAWGGGMCSSAIAQTAIEAGPATSISMGSGDVTVGPSVPNVEEVEAVLWPFRRCETNDDCRDRQFCLSQGECGDPGFCVRRPLGCPDVWDPVCGCDGVTYGNKCEAAAAGVNMDYEGECAAVCGGIQGIPCTNPNDFCRFEEGECCCDFQGVCTPIPDACPEYYDPVCGCDGVTYSNECFANAAGQSVDYQGVCAVACTSNADCLAVTPPFGTYCKKDVGDCDGVGECTPVPQICPAIWDPVCGCDGVTYGNACAAAAASVSVAHEGECEEVCGGILPVQCSDPGDFCKFNEGECCCDFQGVCTPIPDYCPLIWDPVCGCDGVTYGNECLADAAGMSVDHQGACEVPCCDPADEPGVGGNPSCIEGASCCADGTWACNNGDGTPSCDSGTGTVCDPCCDPADEPGVGGNPFCFEGSSCCADGTWACNNGNGTPSCDSGTGTVCDPCCDPADEPGVGGNPICFEGSSCCADGTWACNNGDGTPSCDSGSVCEIGKCCLEGGACIETTKEKCIDQCGVFAGVGTSCTGFMDCPIPPIAIAACCLPDDSCEVTTECICDRRGGTWGSALVCSAATCGGPEICGGLLGIPCSDPDDFCKLNEGQCCCDFLGVCTPVPDLCLLIWDPVCGCDGVTYGNECQADAAEMSIDHQGACDDVCQTNADCAFSGSVPGEFCQKAIGDCNGSGSCSPTPQACLDVYIPVCGCNGQTYSNACYAHRAGVNVASDGACSIDQ